MRLTGWLLDVYAHPDGGLALWLLGDDGVRRQLSQSFPVTFYAVGLDERLRLLRQFLETQPVAVAVSRQERRDLFAASPALVLAAQVDTPHDQPRLFQEATRKFPDLTYYDSDLPISLRHAALHGSFPLARCQVEASPGGLVQALEILDSPWDLDPQPPPLSILSLEPDCDPAHAQPTFVAIRISQGQPSPPPASQPPICRLPLEPERPLLINLRAIINRYDPDLILTHWGDTWLLPHLLKLARRTGLPLPLNRDPARQPAVRRERSYFSYGQIIHRGRQLHLFGRWHIDCANAILYHDYQLEGVLELARVTALPVQNTARVSPGTGISAMQIITALRQGVLVPWRKQQAERPKTAPGLLRSDRGGLVYQPLVGLHRDVAEIDFISMYPSIMARFNISPETVGSSRPGASIVPQLGLPISQEQAGLIPQTLSPLLEKRLTLKIQLAHLPRWDPRRRIYKARASAHKWLLVTCFGYLGYKNARFGRIEAHEAVTAYGRETLLQAKEAAEDMGFRVLHLYVDGMWVQRQGSIQPGDFQPLLDEIAGRTGLSVALDGVYRWVAFLPSRQDERLSVANRYFGAFQDGSLKMRGIEARRRDTPIWVAETQVALLECLARASAAGDPLAGLPAALALVRQRLAELRAGKVPTEKLLVAQKLSRLPDEYRVPSPAGRAAGQLQEVGKHLRPGQVVRYVLILGEPGVHAWDLPVQPPLASLDVRRYAELLLRAAAAVLQPFGIPPADLPDRLANCCQLSILEKLPPGLPGSGL